MEKAYDLKDLGLRLKTKGLVVAEDAAKEVYDTVKEWVKESAVISPNPIDNVAVQGFDYVDSFVYKTIDQIDGQVG